MVASTLLLLKQPLDFIGSKSTSLRNRLEDKVWEKRLAVQTCGNVAVKAPDAHLYGTFAYRSLNRILGQLEWNSDDVFVDIGCGKGRVLACAALYPIKKVIGIDLDEKLCEQARANADSMRGRRAPIEVVHIPAQEYDYRECTKFFLFHPFGAKTLAQVMESIQQSIRDNPRKVDLIYLNPVHEHVLVGQRELKPALHWKRRTWGGLKWDVSFYSNKPQVRPAIPARHSAYVTMLYGLQEFITASGHEGLAALAAI